MTDGDWIPFTKVLGEVGIAYNRDVDEPTLDLYWKALKEIPFPLIRSAAADLVKYEERWPTPAKWRKAVDEVQDRQANDQGRLPGVERPLLPVPVLDPDTGQSVVPVHCLLCADSGWRPDCGCAHRDLNAHGICRVHGARMFHGREYRRAVTACECRPTNPVYLHFNPPKVQKFSRKHGKEE